MRTIVLSIITCFTIPLVACSQDLSGVWSGTLTQDFFSYPFIMETHIIQSGNVLSGESKYALGPDFWGKETFSGTINDNKITLIETKVVDKKGDDPGWCIKLMVGILIINEHANTLSIEGKWTSKGVYQDGKYSNVYRCSPGTFKIFKKLSTEIKMLSAAQSTPTIPAVVTGKVFDRQTNKSVIASISIENKRNFKRIITTSTSGIYSLNLLTNTEYTVIISADNYEQKSEIINLDNTGLNKNFYITPKVAAVQPTVISTLQSPVLHVVRDSKTTVLKNILFSTNTDIFLPTSYESLSSLLRQMKDNPNLRIQVDGHTARYPNSSPQANLDLSLKRATKVKTYLMSNGISADRIQTKGYGDTRLIDRPTSVKNMRVELRVIDTIGVYPPSECNDNLFFN